MNRKYIIIASVVALVLLLGGGVFFIKNRNSSSDAGPVATPTPVAVPQLKPEDAPKVSLSFSSDGHYVTVNLTGVKADQLEYNLIYDATVKTNRIQTGVNASAKLNGKSDYSQKQLLGSESSGHFTYHENIANATLELTLRDSGSHSIYTATYPFTVTPGSSVNLKPSL